MKGSVNIRNLLSKSKERGHITNEEETTPQTYRRNTKSIRTSRWASRRLLSTFNRRTSWHSRGVRRGRNRRNLWGRFAWALRRRL